MADKKIIAVVGATGAQGGGLVRAILSDPGGAFAVRALTRDAESDKAKELAKLGAEVVAADVDDPESLEARVRRRATAPTASPSSGSTSRRRRSWPRRAAWPRRRRHAGVAARHLVDARGHAQVGAARATTACRRCMGKYKVPHFDAKGEADRLFTRARRARRRSC